MKYKELYFPVSSKEMADFFEKTSGIQEDMAQRVMYSVIPHVADPAQVALTNGVVDYNALKHAAEGRHKIIKYGILAVRDELDFCRNKEAISKFDTALASSQGVALDLAIVFFDTPKLWMSGYGGAKWGKIAKTLRQLVRLNNSLNKIKIDKEIGIFDKEKEVQLLRDVIVEMNIFDGLAHNSNNIVNNLVSLENEEEHRSNRKHSLDYAAIKRIMDAKELEDPVEVFKMVEPTLNDSGDANKFKDWISKLKRTNTYRKTDPHLVSKLFKIFFRKEISSHEVSGFLNDVVDHLRDIISSLESNWNQEVFNQNIDYIYISESELKENISEIKKSITVFRKQYPDLTDEKIIDSGIEKIMSSIATQLDRAASSIAASIQRLVFNEDKIENPESIIEALKNIKSGFASISYTLDSI